MNRVAIYGCVAMGTVLGAFLAREGVDVDLVDVYREHVEKLNECGARLVGFEDFTQPVKALTPDQAQGVYDLVILFTKQTANAAAFAEIDRVVDENSTILTLQNGFPEPEVARHFGEDRTLGGAVQWGATFVGPGISEVTEPLSAKPVLFEIPGIGFGVPGYGVSLMIGFLLSIEHKRMNQPDFRNIPIEIKTNIERQKLPFINFRIII